MIEKRFARMKREDFFISGYVQYPNVDEFMSKHGFDLYWRTRYNGYCRIWRERERHLADLKRTRTYRGMNGPVSREEYVVLARPGNWAKPSHSLSKKKNAKCTYKSYSKKYIKQKSQILADISYKEQLRELKENT